jgi:hypothetical protein
MTEKSFDGTIAPGDCVRLSSLASVMQTITAHFSAGKGLVFVAVILGKEPKDGSQPLDLVRAMNELGWFQHSDWKAIEAKLVWAREFASDEGFDIDQVPVPK